MVAADDTTDAKARAGYRLQRVRGRPCGRLDEALVSGTRVCRFEPCQGHALRVATTVRRRCPPRRAPLQRVFLFFVATFFLVRLVVFVRFVFVGRVS